ncbi:MAG: glycoside hydrolase family 99-like domain-containing protein, partial [Bacteroidales bacterium]|nr:glycoside hydrolase family 99-like domain-containing protein [Bacteroidales bacterium]
MRALLSLLLVGVLAGCAATPQSGYDVAAFVWPAYFDEPRFRDIGVFPDGKGEWESIYNAKPKFDGHKQPRVPLWGYLDEASPKTQERIIKTALKYGVNTFIFDWYWYDNRPFLEDVLNKGFLRAKNNLKAKFYLMWANHTHNSYLDYTNPDKSKVYWQGGVSREVFDGFCAHLINDYFKRPNYYRID